ncbi:MAG: hypothetical protein ACI4SS_01860 [Clostridia bacterium]
MKKFLKVLGIIILVIVIAVAAVAVWQWKYVKAVWDGVMNDEKALAEKQVKATEKTVSKVSEYFTAPIRELTEEEKEKIAAGELSQTALLAQIISEATGVPLEDETEKPGPVADGQPTQDSPAEPEGNNQSGDNKQQTSPSEPAVTPAPEPAKNADQLVAASVNKLYSLQSQYSAQIAGLVGRAKAYYKEQKAANGSAAAKSSTLATFSGEVASMENACDAKVEAVLGELTAELNAIGADTSIVGTLRSAYNSEKSAQRAAYVSKYMK